MKVSNCCGAAPTIFGECDCDTMELGLCPECMDHCEYVEEEEFENDDDPEIPATPTEGD